MYTSERKGCVIIFSCQEAIIPYELKTIMIYNILNVHQNEHNLAINTCRHFFDMIQVRPYHLLLSPSPNSQLKQQHCNILLEGKTLLMKISS